jgi:hypothetical protein
MVNGPLSLTSAVLSWIMTIIDTGFLLAAARVNTVAGFDDRSLLEGPSSPACMMGAAGAEPEECTSRWHLQMNFPSLSSSSAMQQSFSPS